MESLLGPWASAPVPEGYTFGVEIEFALHGEESKRGVCLPYSTAAWEKLACPAVGDSLRDYLQRMGMSDDWR
jgi:hypothetical protein